MLIASRNAASVFSGALPRPSAMRDTRVKHHSLFYRVHGNMIPSAPQPSFSTIPHSLHPVTNFVPQWRRSPLFLLPVDTDRKRRAKPWRQFFHRSRLRRLCQHRMKLQLTFPSLLHSAVKTPVSADFGDFVPENTKLPSYRRSTSFVRFEALQHMRMAADDQVRSRIDVLRGPSLTW